MLDLAFSMTFGPYLRKRPPSSANHIADIGQDAIRRYPNVQSITAYMPEAYGTHHSKMMILFRHDEQAQYDCVIVRVV